MSAGITQFDSVIAPLSRDAFLADYWNKSFLHMPGEKARFTALLTWDELNQILEQHRLAPPRFKLVQDGRFIDPDKYVRAGEGGAPFLDLGKLVACLSQGATLVLGAVKELAPRVQILTRSFQEALGADNFVNLYAGWRSQNGFDVHWDAQDSIVLQLSGRKRWQIFKPTRAFPLEKDLEAPPKPTGAPAWDGVLEDGDALYIPRGWWHVVHPLNEASLHLTVSSTPPHGMDLLQWLTGRMRRHEIVRRDLPLANDPAGQQAYMAQLRALMMEALSDTAIAEYRGLPIAEAQILPHIRLPQAPYDHGAPLTMQTRIRLASAQGLSFIPRPGGQVSEFRTSGRVWSCPTDLVPALQSLSDKIALPYSDLCARLPNEAAAAHLKNCLVSLARTGIVVLEGA